MDQDWILSAGATCSDCGGRCCQGARLPLSPARSALIASRGLLNGHIGFARYHRMAADGQGWCAVLREGRCAIHCIKPKTCVAEPFSFDIREGMLEIYLKRKIICPLAGLFRKNPKAYRIHHDHAAHEIVRLVRKLPFPELKAVLQVDEPKTDRVETNPLEGL
jgi:Fe-S-cluster containining protein